VDEELVADLERVGYVVNAIALTSLQRNAHSGIQCTEPLASSNYYYSTVITVLELPGLIRL
jgi:hypothetical protein